MLDLVTVGDVMLDVHSPAPHPHGGRLHAPIWIAPGGSAVNAALAAAELGASAGVAGCVGDDPAGRAIRSELDRRGIADLLATAPDSTGTTVFVGGSVVADRGANAAFEPGELPEARITLISGYLEPDQLQAALAGARGLVAVDLQGRHHDLPRVDVVLGPGIDLEAYDAGVVCSTVGPDGAVATDGVELLSAEPPELVPDVLRGAGDRFAASFLLGLAAGRPLQECLTEACAFGSRTPTAH